jgi:hypothetical protein
MNVRHADVAEWAWVTARKALNQDQTNHEELLVLDLCATLAAMSANDIQER